MGIFAAILLRLKSNILKGIDITDFDPEPQLDEFEYGDDGELEYSEDFIPTSNVMSIDEKQIIELLVKLINSQFISLKIVDNKETYSLEEKVK